MLVLEISHIEFARPLTRQNAADRQASRNRPPPVSDVVLRDPAPAVYPQIVDVRLEPIIHPTLTRGGSAMPIFSHLNLDEVPDSPHVPDGDYTVEVIDVLLKSYPVNDVEHAGAVGHKIAFVYEVLEGPYAEMPVYSRDQWANPWDSRVRKSHLKRMLRTHGIPETQTLAELERADLVGRQVRAQVRGGLVVAVEPIVGYRGAGRALA